MIPTRLRRPLLVRVVAVAAEAAEVRQAATTMVLLLPGAVAVAVVAAERCRFKDCP